MFRCKFKFTKLIKIDQNPFFVTFVCLPKFSFSDIGQVSQATTHFILDWAMTYYEYFKITAAEDLDTESNRDYLRDLDVLEFLNIRGK